jgi:hypothetical protein
MTKEDLIIVYLSLSLLFVQYQWLQAERKASYLQGKLEAFTFLETDHDDGMRYVIDGRKGKHK